MTYLDFTPFVIFAVVVAVLAVITTAIQNMAQGIRSRHRKFMMSRPLPYVLRRKVLAEDSGPVNDNVVEFRPRSMQPGLAARQRL